MKNNNKNQILPNEILECCTHYKTSKYTQGYIMIKPIKILRCENCGDVHLVANKFWSFIFTHFLRLFWRGTIVLYEEVDNENQE